MKIVVIISKLVLCQLKAAVTHRDRVPITPILIIIIIIIRAFVRRTMSASELILILTQYVFLHCADPYCKTEGALHGRYIMWYSEQYVRLKRNVFSRRRKATVDFVLFSSVGSWFRARGAAVENARSAIFRFVRGTT